MEHFTKTELKEALRAIVSTVKKCEKVQEKQTLGLSQQTLLINRIKAFKIAAALIEKELQTE